MSRPFAPLSVPPSARRPRPSQWLAVGLVLACLTSLAPAPTWAQHDRGFEHGNRFGQRGLRAHEWWDGDHGHGRAYPVPGYRVIAPPPQARFVFYGGTRYAFHEGIWYAPGPGGFIVVRPPFGVVIDGLPAFATLLTIGAVSYWYANGTYYRAAPTGGYEVVAPPPGVDEPTPGANRVFVYPRQGQSAEKQSNDEYECHRWAVEQSGYDPTAASSGNPSARTDYTRAQAACLEGRGYTVK